MNKITVFTDLLAWQEAHKFVLMVYKITKDFPKDEQFSLVNQMRRAAVSITSNIAEGFGRQGYKEKIQFFYIAKGSLTELENQILISRDIGYLTGNETLYTKLQQYGYVVVFKPTLEVKGVIKGNCDAELVLHAMIEYPNYDKAMIISGDGDFHCLIEYFLEQNKLLKVGIPNKRKYSSLLRKFHHPHF